MKDDYVSFEIAKLLKEKGFDGDTSSCYILEDSTHHIMNDKVVQSEYYESQDSNEHGHLIQAPTHQMAMKWLREKGIYITIVYGDYPSLNKVFWTPQIDSLEGFDLPNSFYEEYDKYEVAVEAALRYALENLI